MFVSIIFMFFEKTTDAEFMWNTEYSEILLQYKSAVFYVNL